MVKRPLCWVAVCFILLLLLLDASGLPVIRRDPIPAGISAWIRGHPQVEVAGRVHSLKQTDHGFLAILEQAELDYPGGASCPVYNLKAFLKQDMGVKIGDRVRLQGIMERVPPPSNPGEFDSRQYHACDHIYYFLKQAQVIECRPEAFSLVRLLMQLRSAAYDRLRICTGESAPVFGALILGEKSGLDPELKSLYQMGGILHILAVSGLHISVLGLGLFSLLKKCRLGMVFSAILSLGFMVLFGMLTGGSISAWRAVCMFLIVCGAKLTGRSYDLLTALAISSTLILLESPARLLSASFLFSFGAVLGIALILPVFACALPSPSEIRGKKARILWGIVQALAGSVSVMLMTLPVSLRFYGEVSLAGLFLNLIVLPTTGMVLTSGCACLVLGLFSQITGGGILSQAVVKTAFWASLPGQLVLKGYEELCRLATRLPGCVWTGGCPRLWQILVYYAGLLLAMLWLRTVWRNGRKEDPAGIPKITSGWPALVVLAACIWLLGLHRIDGLEITCLDVGQGDGILLQTADGHAWLIDGGSSSKNLTGSSVLLPALKHQGISHLDGILISHTDEDHYNGVQELLELKSRLPGVMAIDTLYLPAWSDPPPGWFHLADLAARCGIQVKPLTQGNRLILNGTGGCRSKSALPQCEEHAGELTFSVLAPLPGSRGENVNEEGMVLTIRFGKFLGLFTGDMGEETEMRLLDLFPDVDFLKVGHHGSRYSSSEPFLQAVKPELAVISCAAVNRYGHPAPETVRRLEAIGCKVYYTMKNGAVTVHTDGEEMWVNAYLPGSTCV